VRLELITIVVDDYDRAIEFFTGVLGFDLVEDSPSLTNDGRPKRWVVVRPPGAQTGVLLARADGPRQAAAVGNQVAGRVGFFLRVDDFDAAHQRMTAAGVEFLTSPRTESYGRVAVFRDIAGNRWDLLGPSLSRFPGRLEDPGPSVGVADGHLLGAVVGLLERGDNLDRRILLERVRVGGGLQYELEPGRLVFRHLGDEQVGTLPVPQHA
jgi:catechol 2,3-dioxygenase-like lactoylglutathione lyase family enzyme